MKIVKTIKNARIMYDTDEYFQGFNLFVKEKDYDGDEQYGYQGVLSKEQTQHKDVKYLPLNYLISMDSPTPDFNVIKLTKGVIYVDDNGFPTYHGNVVLYKK
jgi:hypothetical protein